MARSECREDIGLCTIRPAYEASSKACGGEPFSTYAPKFDQLLSQASQTPALAQ